MAPVPQVPPPRGWRWVSEWEVDTEHREDLDGWSYARRFRELVHPPPTSALRPKRLHFVRFRRFGRPPIRSTRNKGYTRIRRHDWSRLFEGQWTLRGTQAVQTW
eukprot:9469547-Pyramimonas_sp.AAC.1